MNKKNTKKSAIHENADANISCKYRDGDISRLGVAYLTHAIHDTYLYLYLYLYLLNGPGLEDLIGQVGCSRPVVNFYLFNTSLAGL